MKRAVMGLLFLAFAFPAAAEQVVECRSIGGHHYYNDRISAARYVRLYGLRMVTTGRSGRHDMPTWSLRCGPTEKGIFCTRRSGRAIVNIWTDGWRMKEMVIDRRGGEEVFHIVYNCNHEMVLP